MIHADDAGLCASVNRGTIRAMQEGVVTSASVMVPCPGFDEFAAFARSQPDSDFGVHLTFTSEWSDLRWGPVSKVNEVPSLVDESGMFWRSADRFAAHAVVHEVEIELRAQVERARSAGVRLSHLDCHMNALLRRADLMELLVRMSLELELPVRFAKQLPEGWKDAIPAEIVAAYYEQLKVLYTGHSPLADVIEHDNYVVAAEEKRAYFLQVLRDLRPGVTEIVVHCCEPRADEWTPPDAAGRVADTEVFLTREIVDEITTLGMRLIDWRTFREMTRPVTATHW